MLVLNLFSELLLCVDDYIFSRMINYFMRKGGVYAHALGTIAVMYSALGCGFYFARGKKEDSINTVSAGTLTGLIYKSPSGLKKSAIGGAIGLVLSGIYVLVNSKDKSSAWS